MSGTAAWLCPHTRYDCSNHYLVSLPLLFSQRNDGEANVLGALTIAGHYVIPEVCLYFDNKLMRGNR